MRLKEKVALITGGASGIGRATSIIFGKEGAKVVVVDMNEEGSKETVQLVKASGGEAMFVIADVSKTTDVQRMVKTTVDIYGRLDILVNNAGIVLTGPLEETTEEQYEKVVNINLKGVFLGSKYAIPHMKQQGGGVIVNTASIAGRVGFANQPLYCATKGGVMAMTRALALDLAPYNVRVNAVSPGNVDTPSLNNYVRIQD